MKRSTLSKNGSKSASTTGLKQLVKGVHKFQHEHFAENKILFERLAHGQKPQVLLITCADSRIDPNLITGSQPGDLFIMRNVANLVPQYDPSTPTEAGAVIEYAVSVLGVTDIVIMGHSDCGGIKGVMHPDKLTSLPSVSGWLNHAVSTQGHCCSVCAESEQLAKMTRSNVLLQLEHLRTYPDVAANLAAGKLHVHGWLYQIETGSVSHFDQSKKHWREL